jgi:RDD family
VSRIQVPDSQTLLNGIHPGWYRNIQLANWGLRVVSGAIDYIMVPFPFIVILGAFISPRAMWITVYLIWWLNSAFLQGHTGQSVGKRILGMKVFYPKIGYGNEFVPDFPGVVRCTWRLVLHFFDLILLCLGFIRPIWHFWRQTYADSVAHTYVGKDTNLYLERTKGAYDQPRMVAQ